MSWQPIDTAPDGVMVVVFWLEDDHIDPKRYDFDMLEDGGWVSHNNNREHYLMVGGPSLGPGPKDDAPYTHWLPLGEPDQTSGGQS